MRLVTHSRVGKDMNLLAPQFEFGSAITYSPTIIYFLSAYREVGLPVITATIPGIAIWRS